MDVLLSQTTSEYVSLLEHLLMVKTSSQVATMACHGLYVMGVPGIRGHAKAET